MRLRLFRAASMAEAMAQLRADLGPEALILSTRRCGGGVEITAALEPALPDPDDPPPLPQADPARLATLLYHAVPPTLHAALQDGPLDAALRALFVFARLPLGGQDKPLLLAGPPGAGKTLTAARLATRLVMAGERPMVISADGQRAGATEQLAAYTRLLGLDLVVASHPVSLARALARRPTDTPMLIDTAGCDIHDPGQRTALADCAAAADATLALVLPAGLDAAESADLGAAFADAGAAALIVTRLDLSRRLGGVLAAASAGRLPLAEAGIGPGAADGLAPCTPALLAERLLRPHSPTPEPRR